MLLLSVDDLPAVPFDFGPGCRIVDAGKFLAALRRDAMAGSFGTRSRYGVAEQDFRRLRDLLTGS